MPRLLAIIPEDGWAMVREGQTTFFLRPPFRNAERVPVSEATLADAVAVHGYEASPDAPEESWAEAVERIRGIMVHANEDRELPSNMELLSRVLRSGPLSVLTALLDRVDQEWLPRSDMRAADRALKALFAEDRVKNDRVLLERALQLRQRLDHLRDEKDARAPIRLRPPRIEDVARRPGVASCKARLKGFGAASMVGTGT